MGGDTHVYENHGHLVAEQRARVPRALPRLTIAAPRASIDDYRFEDFSIEGYDPHSAIAAPVAV